MKSKKVVRALGALLLATCAAAAQAAPFAYISRADGAVAVIDTASQNIVGVIGTGGRPEGLAVSLQGRYGYIANAASDQVHIVDTPARAVIANIPLAPGPSAVVLNPAETRAYVLHPGTGSSSQLSIINTETRGTAGTIIFANRAERLEMSADGTRLWVSHTLANAVSVVNTTTNEVVAMIGTGPAPYGMVHDRGLDRLYVASAGSNTVTIINAANHTAIASVALPGCQNPRNLALNPPATRLFVTCEDNNVVASLNLGTLAVTLVNVGTRPTAVQVTPDGALVYVVNSGSGNVSVLQEDNPAFLRGLVNVGGTLSGFGKFIGGPTTITESPALPGPLSGLWWNASESGWGIHLTQRRNTVFAAWFTYDPVGAPRWYVASSCSMAQPLSCPTCVDNTSCSGALYEANGARFFREPFNPAAVQITTVGSLRIDFRNANDATMSYGVGGRTRTVAIQRQVFQTGSAPPATDYTDLWWNPAESGWGLGITQQFGIMFLTWFVYEDTSRPIWYVASSCVVKSLGNGCSGTLYRTAGPPGPAASNSFDASQVRVNGVGTIDVTFTDANNGIINYTVDNVSGSKAITRQLF
jgi:YVTN family beta-propeller protein